ncbi:MAG: hypothetical protein EAZ90_24055 [Oscillatoriales cyanobacterium]|nr:MAG: hypothetical protein EAZ90_24055 [Oscillatoriales cyanobacterium]TAG95322.1 MAG: hypothetical protein EAZ19_11965 [Oscillatoriales cyanobacterium]
MNFELGAISRLKESDLCTGGQKPGFYENTWLQSIKPQKTRFLGSEMGVQKPGFYENSSLQSIKPQKTRFLWS